MKIVETRYLPGPNRWSKRPCFEALLDLGALGPRSCGEFPGFAVRLAALFPGDDSVAGVGRLTPDASIAQVVATVASVLQRAADAKPAFAYAQAARGNPGLHSIAVGAPSERLARAALPSAIAVVQASCAGRDVELAGELARLRAIAAEAAPAPEERAILEAAERRGIPHLRIGDEAGLLQLGWGTQQRRVQATFTSNTNHIAVRIARDRPLAKRLLVEAGVPVPEGEVVATAEQAVAAARRLRWAVVVKPLDAGERKGVSTRLRSPDEVRAAFERARRHGPRVIVERCLDGADHRVMVVGGRFMAAARRSPPQVVGDGWRSLLELIEAQNRDPRRGGGTQPLGRIPVDDTTHEVLARQGLSLQSVPPAGMTVVLRGNADLATGGAAEDVTERTHPDVADACVRAARTIGLDVAGLDLVCCDIARPLEAQGGGIVDVKAAPGIRMHEHAGEGGGHRVGDAIVESLFASGGDGRIPVVAIAGAHGRTATALLVAHAMRECGLVTGLATAHGIRIGNHFVCAGDCTGYDAARAVLTSPDVEAAILETARGGIVERGLGFDRCDVAVVMNVEADDDARAWRVVAESATKAVILDACDERCVAMAPRLERDAHPIYFSTRDSNRVLVEHLERGGRAVYLRKDRVVMATGEHRTALIEADRLPFARHDEASALAAAAALWACGFPPERIVSTLCGLGAGLERHPAGLDALTPPGERRAAVPH